LALARESSMLHAITFIFFVAELFLFCFAFFLFSNLFVFSVCYQTRNKEKKKKQEI